MFAALEAKGENPMRLLRLSIVLLLVLIPTIGALGASKHRKALKMLKLLKEVDGAGSGLDADTVRGLVPLVLVDAAGRVVGTYIGDAGNDVDAVIVRRINDKPVRLIIGGAGFRANSNALLFLYESDDCTGPRLMYPGLGAGSEVGVFPPFAYVAGHIATYATNPALHATRSSSVNGVSEAQCPPPSIFTPPDTCCTASPPNEAQVLGEAVTFDLDTLGLTPPFQLDVPQTAASP